LINLCNSKTFITCIIPLSEIFSSIKSIPGASKIPNFKQNYDKIFKPNTNSRSLFFWSASVYVAIPLKMMKARYFFLFVTPTENLGNPLKPQQTIKTPPSNKIAKLKEIKETLLFLKPQAPST
jgi:hypothetical protein